MFSKKTKQSKIHFINMVFRCKTLFIQLFVYICKKKQKTFYFAGHPKWPAHNDYWIIFSWVESLLVFFHLDSVREDRVHFWNLIWGVGITLPVFQVPVQQWLWILYVTSIWEIMYTQWYTNQNILHNFFQCIHWNLDFTYISHELN